MVNDHAKRKHAALVGQQVEILCEGPSKTNPLRLSGRTRTNKIVVFEGRPRHVGQIFAVKVVHSSGFTLYAEADGETETSGGETALAAESIHRYVTANAEPTVEEAAAAAAPVSF